MSDLSGWDDPSLYATIQFADVTGDRGAELIVRGHDGLYVSRYTATGWTQVAGWLRVPTGSDAGGWQLPETYSTIQAGSIAGDGKAEIIGRAANGVQTWTYDSGQGKFTSTIKRGFPEFTGAELDAYRWIGRTRFALKGTEDIRAQYNNTDYTSAYWANAAIWLGDNAAQPPADLDISASEWSTVARQLEAEFSYVEALYTWFGNVNDFLTQVFDEKILSVETVTSAINLPSESRGEVGFDAIGLILNFGAALVGLGGPPGEVAEAVMHIVHNSMEAARLAAGKPPDIQTQVYKLEDELQDWNTRARDANVCLQQAFLEHWGLLKAMGEPIVANDLSWPSTLTRTLVNSARREYEIGLYETLTPVKWWVVGSISDDTKDPCTGDFNDPPGALRQTLSDRPERLRTLVLATRVGALEPHAIGDPP